MMSESTLGSKPLSTPRERASAVPAIWMASSMLLQILAVWPAPAVPAWKTLAPMMSKNGRARSKASASPPTMKVRVPFWAPAVPPDTGASSMATPFSAAAAATRWAVPGSMVLQSMTKAPLGKRSNTPWSR